MNEYQDRWGRWHDKECVNGEPSSNNGWIFTAYAKKMGFEVDRGLLMECAERSMIRRGDKIVFSRSPGKLTPPMSRDEILGMVYLGVVGFRDSWYFGPYEYPSFNPFKTLAALWRMKKAHRNALWEGKGEPHLFRFAFSVPIQDRAFILRCQGEDVPWYYRLVEWVDQRRKSSSLSSRLIHQFKYDNRFDTEDLAKYFGLFHPFI